MIALWDAKSHFATCRSGLCSGKYQHRPFLISKHQNIQIASIAYRICCVFLLDLSINFSLIAQDAFFQPVSSSLVNFSLSYIPKPRSCQHTVTSVQQSMLAVEDSVLANNLQPSLGTGRSYPQDRWNRIVAKAQYCGWTFAAIDQSLQAVDMTCMSCKCSVGIRVISSREVFASTHTVAFDSLSSPSR